MESSFSNVFPLCCCLPIKKKNNAHNILYRNVFMDLELQEMSQSNKQEHDPVGTYEPPTYEPPTYQQSVSHTMK